MADGEKASGDPSKKWRTVTLPSGRTVTIAVVKKTQTKAGDSAKEK